jgi:hypothetical protein
MGNDMVTMNVSAYPTGIYVLKAQTEDGNVMVKKVSIVH